MINVFQCSRCVTVLERSVLDAVGPVGVVGNQTVRQRSGRVPDLRLHVVSSSPGQGTSVHCKLCGGFSENSCRREEGGTYVLRDTHKISLLVIVSPDPSVKTAV